MLTIAVIIWILYQLQAPDWCYVLMGITLASRIFDFCKGLYKLGAEHRLEG